ncbi:hypothetical protein [Massilia arenae]|uniref:hypothetical protein n=1 Tax=Massilia arenae TaxID=2603288 RepID=UPI001E5254D4|nr:hypothetical protein [Massilia arenae]
MANELTQGKIMQALDWAYEKAVAGVPGLDSADEMAQDYLKVMAAWRTALIP